MTEIERKQVAAVFEKVAELAYVLNPELFPAKRKPGEFDFENLFNTMDLLRVQTKYILFDLEACRRDIQKLDGIIRSGGAEE